MSESQLASSHLKGSIILDLDETVWGMSIVLKDKYINPIAMRDRDAFRHVFIQTDGYEYHAHYTKESVALLQALEAAYQGGVNILIVTAATYDYQVVSNLLAQIASHSHITLTFISADKYFNRYNLTPYQVRNSDFLNWSKARFILHGFSVAWPKPLVMIDDQAFQLSEATRCGFECTVAANSIMRTKESSYLGLFKTRVICLASGGFAVDVRRCIQNMFNITVPPIEQAVIEQASEEDEYVHVNSYS